MKKNKKYIIGIDLGGTKMMAGLLDKKFDLVASEKQKVQPEEGEKFFLKSIVKTVETVLSKGKVNLNKILGIGIGCPGIINTRKGIVTSSPNIHFLKNYPLAVKLEKYFALPVVLENDVNAGLFGEQQFGAAKNFSHVVGIFLGTGIGGALILNGQLYEGAFGAAGEIGHMLVDDLGPGCGCGKRGCLEALAGRVAIAGEAAVLASKQRAPELYRLAGTEVSKIKSGVLAKSIKSGDKSIEDLVLLKADLLGKVMGNIANLLNPELIVLGGGMMEALGNLILPQARESMVRNAMPAIAHHVKVSPAKLGDYAIVKGSAKMAFDKIMKEK